MNTSAQIKDIILASSTPIDAYANLLASKNIGFDRGQKKVVETLQVMFDYILSDTFRVRGQGFFAKFREKNALPPRCGAYIWGDVGRGKSMLMDMFYNLVPIPNKRRLHFHAFMQDVHARLHRLRQAKSSTDLLKQVVEELSSEFHLLCLDEFQVHDVTDAMILSRLFRALFQKGVLVIFTSNREPKNLYLNGLQRDQFLPFIELLEGHVEIIELLGRTDYRLEQIKALKQVFFHPLGFKADKFLLDSYLALTRGNTTSSMMLEINERKLEVKRVAGGVAWFSFAELCEEPLGAGDYLEIASKFHTILLKDIPRLSPEKRNEAKRFVTLIDALYESKTNLICTADTAPEDLYPEGDGSFEFARTVSRLKEMQSESYLEISHVNA